MHDPLSISCALPRQEGNKSFIQIGVLIEPDEAMLKSGMAFLTASLIGCCLALFASMYWAMKYKPPKVRSLPAFKAIEDGIARAVELGRPVHYTVGIRNLQNVGTVSALGLLRFVSEKCAKLGARLITTVCFSEIIPIVEELYETASDMSARPDALRKDDIRYMSDEQYAYAAGILGILHRENVATNLIFGDHAGSCMILAEGGYIAGCFQVGSPGTAIQFTSPMGIAMDHFLISEEAFAMATAAEGDPEVVGTLRGQDWMKVFIVVSTLAGVALETVGVKWLTQLFGA